MIRALCVAFLFLLATPLAAQNPLSGVAADSAVTDTAPVDPLGRGTPRGMVSGLVAALAAGDYNRGAQFLDLSGVTEANRSVEGPTLARALQTALDRSGGILPSYNLSSAAEGSKADGLPPDQDRFAVIRTDKGLTDLIANRREDPVDGPVWLVSPDTLTLVRYSAYFMAEGLVDQWSPAVLKTERFAGAPLAHWLAMLVIAALALLLARALTLAVFWVLGRIWPALRTERPRAIGRAILLPAGLFMACLMFSLTTFLIGISFVARAQVAPGVEILSWIALGWLAWRAVDTGAQASLEAMARRSQVGAVSVVTLLRRAAKLVVIMLALMAIAGSLGINLTGWLAALGIGGLAFALGAQKTIEHFVGSLSLIVDQPIRVGDFCQVDGLLGTVEDIGMRSTRLRTLDRTIVTIPNGTMSQSVIENYASRDRFRFNPLLTLVYETTPDQMRELLSRLRQLLADDMRMVPESARVRFKAFGDSSLDVEIFCYVVATDYAAFLEIQEQLNLSIMQIISDCGSGFAFPSRTVYLRNETTDVEGKPATLLVTE
ncbi:MAG: mechanosensitive ion channel family protein [Cypionkella sp.]